MKKLIIGLTCNLYHEKYKNFSDAFRYSLYEDNAIVISKAGAVPIILPVLWKEEEIHSFFDIVDGIVLVGGNTPISPTLYSSSVKPMPSEKSILRHDIYNIALIQGAIKRSIPFFGICRGFEMINVALGGSLCNCEDFPDKKTEKKTFHNIKADQTHIAHTLKVKKNTILQSIVGETTLLMNSFHKQCIARLSPDLQANAFAEDGVVEGFEWREDLKVKRPFMISFQGHPEMLATHGSPEVQKNALDIFAYFVKKVQEDYKTRQKK